MSWFTKIGTSEEKFLRDEMDAEPAGADTFTRYAWMSGDDLRNLISSNNGLPMNSGHDALPSGWHHLHVGGEEWVAILNKDYGNEGPVCEITISNLPSGFYLMSDPDRMYGKVDSWMLISKSPIIPASCVEITFEKDTEEAIQDSGFEYDEHYWEWA